MKRAEILDEAKQMVTKDRAADHGDLQDNFNTIASYWSVHLGIDVTAVDVGVMMTLLKTLMKSIQLVQVLAMASH